jgi:hypothetical protein
MWLSHARLVPVPLGWGSSCSTWSWSPAGPDGQGKSKGQGPVVPHIAAAQQGLNGGGLGGPVSWQGVGPDPSWGLVQKGGRVPGGHGSGSAAEG